VGAATEYRGHYAHPYDPMYYLWVYQVHSITCPCIGCFIVRSHPCVVWVHGYTGTT
jgi:hypothetical protein